MSVTSGIMLSDNMGASKDAMDEEGNAAADLGLVARIRESFDSLTATEREAAHFILGHLTEAQRRAYRIADNKLTGTSIFDCFRGNGIAGSARSAAATFS